MVNPDKLVARPFAPWDIDCSKDPQITKQEFKKDCDVNLIIARCVKSGLPLPSATMAPVYADVSQFGSYVESLDRVNRANEIFSALPAEIRREFDNDPAKLISFVQDPANASKAIELGLATAPAVVDGAAPSPAAPPEQAGAPLGAPAVSTP